MFLPNFPETHENINFEKQMEEDKIERITEWPVTANLSYVDEKNSELQHEDQSSNSACSPLRKKKKIENKQSFPGTKTSGMFH